jgi:tRNA threonylcarbamoyladenosine biosynthesis protein TsaE
MSRTLTIDLPDPEVTEALGRRLGALLFPGAVVALDGPLGAGKTQLVRAVAAGLGLADTRIVTSPTFVLLQEYSARLPVYHFDAYRLRSEAEFFDLGGHEYLAGEGVSLIEWAERIPGCLPREHLSIRLEVTGASSRHVVLEAHGTAYENVLRALEAAPSP